MCLAVPGRIVSIQEEADDALRTAVVDFAGVRRQVSLAFTPEARPGDYVMVHVGFAISVVDENEAERIFQELARLGASEPRQDNSP